MHIVTHSEYYYLSIIHSCTDLVVYVEVNATLGIVEGGDVLEEFPDKGSRLLQEESNHHCGVVLVLNIDRQSQGKHKHITVGQSSQ